MADIDTLIAELRAGLEGTTPGEWTRRDTPDYAEMIAPDQKQPLALVGRAEDADYIALASPQNIRALLDHIERQANALAMWDQVREGVAHVIGENAEWQINGNAPLAVMASYMLRVCERNKAEAELARLRAPVTDGEVKGVVRSLSLIACAPRCEHASECNCTVLDNAAELIQRLAGQVAEAQQDRCVPTCHEIADKAFAARDAAETRLREAVEVMREADDHLYEINMSNYDHDEVTRLNAGSVNASLALRAFLTTLEDHSNG